MNFDPRAVLKYRILNGWSLFWLVAVPMSAVMIVRMSGTDLSAGPGVSEMIGFSVRWAVPFIFVVVASSSLQYLFPGPLPAWLLRNRKYLGMCFACAMAWQGLFIFMMSTFHRDYYHEDIYLLRDELEGSTGYLFLVALVITSFDSIRRRFSLQQWKVLHTFGICFLWAYPFSVYWWNLFYYGNPQAIDYMFYCGGFLAFAVRIAAWGKKRAMRSRADRTPDSAPGILKFLGAGVVAFGLLVAATGLYWQESVTEFLTAPDWSARLELWFPYWPFEPFLSLMVIAAGVHLYTHEGRLNPVVASRGAAARR